MTPGIADTSVFIARESGRALDATRLGTAHDEQIPVTFHPGAVPTADLQPSAGATLEAFQGAAQPGCSLRTLQRSGSAPEPTTDGADAADTGLQGGSG